MIFKHKEVKKNDGRHIAPSKKNSLQKENGVTDFDNHILKDYQKIQQKADNSFIVKNTDSLQLRVDDYQQKKENDFPIAQNESSLDDLNQINLDSHLLNIQEKQLSEREKKALPVNDLGKMSDKKIELHGELTTSAKIKGFFGLNSTWDKFSKGVAQFNQTENVSRKQEILSELKPLAREWIKRHDVSGKDISQVDENDILKQKTIYQFLNQTKSNFEKIHLLYEKVLQELLNLNSNLNSENILAVFNDYKNFKKECEIYFKEYPPEINLLFLNESAEINDFQNNLDSKAYQISSKNSFKTDTGLEITTPSLSLNLEGSAQIYGGVSWSFENIYDINGSVSAVFDSSGFKFDSVKINDASAHTEIHGISYLIEGLSYDSGLFTVNKLEGAVSLFDQNIVISGVNVMIDNGMISYDYLIAKFEGDLCISNGIVVSNPFGQYNSNGELTLSGEFSLKLPGVETSSGKITCSFNNGILSDISFLNASVAANIYGVSFNFQEIDYHNNVLSIGSAMGTLDIWGATFDIEATDLEIDQNNNLNFESISGNLPGIDVGFFSTNETFLEYDKSEGKFLAKTSYSFRNDQISEDFKNFKTKGVILIEYIPNVGPCFMIEEGAISFEAFGQEINASEIIYKSDSPLLINVGQFNLKTNINGYNPSFSGKNVIIDSLGIHFDELKTEPNITPPILGPFSVQPKTILISEKTEDYSLTIDGRLEGNFPNQFGSVLGALEGGVIFSTVSKNMDYYISNGEAEMSIRNPLNQISELLGENWMGSRFEIGADIPVFPGVFGVFGIFLAFNASFEDLKGKIHVDESNNILINLNSGISAKIDGGIFGGVQAGSPILASIALLLEMVASSQTTLDLGYQKHLDFQEDTFDQSQIDPKKNKRNFLYKLSGETKGKLNLTAVAKALYFFQKRFELNLAQASIGEFEFSNEKTKIPNPKEKIFFSNQDLKDQVSEDISDEAKSAVSTMTAKDLLDLETNKRFEKREKKEVLAIFGQAETDRGLLKDTKENGESFDDSSFTNLYFFTEFIDNRVDWNYFLELKNILTAEKCESLIKTEHGKEELKQIIEEMGQKNNIASSFINHYNSKVKDLKNATKGFKSNDNGLFQILEEKKIVYENAEEFKKNHLHSAFWGDQSKQEKNIKKSRSLTEILTFKQSGFKSFSKDLNTFFGTLTEFGNGIPIEKNKQLLQLKGSEYLSKLRSEHKVKKRRPNS